MSTPPLTNITNLSRFFVLDTHEIEVLNRGLSFVPTPRRLDQSELLRDVHAYHRRLKLLEFFDFECLGERIPFQAPSNWEPADTQISDLLLKHCQKDLSIIHNMNLKSRSGANSNLTTEQQRALRGLQNNELIVIKPADKGSRIVIMDRAQFIREAECQLSNGEH